MSPLSMTATATEWVTDPARFAAVAPAWDELAEAVATPFLRHAWLGSWWEAFGARRGDLRVCLVWRGDELAAGLALLRRGRRLEALADWHTPRFGAVARDDEARGELAEALRRDQPDQLVLTALVAGDPLARALRPACDRVLEEPHAVSPVVDIDGDWDAYRALTRPRWGAPLERFRRKMVREHAAAFELVVAPADLERRLDRGFEVEASGWKGREGTAILSTPQTAAFYRAVARAFDASGELRLSWLELDGQMAAFDLCLLHGERLYLLKTGYDEAHRRLAPGLVLRLSVLERCFELGLQAHELLGGDDAWKLKFATSERRHETVRCFGRGPSARAGYAYRRWARPALRSAYRRVRAARAATAE